MLFDPLYLLLKFLAYAGWCYAGIGYLKVGRSPRASWAFLFGFIRFALGFGFGILIWILGTFVMIGMYEVSGGESFSFAAVLTYLLVYVPVRWVEWSLLEVIMKTASSSWKMFFLGSDRRSRLWRVGGIFLSCASDIPVIFSYSGLPLGRFTC